MVLYDDRSKMIDGNIVKCGDHRCGIFVHNNLPYLSVYNRRSQASPVAAARRFLVVVFVDLTVEYNNDHNNTESEHIYIEDWTIERDKRTRITLQDITHEHHKTLHLDR